MFSFLGIAQDSVCFEYLCELNAVILLVDVLPLEISFGALNYNSRVWKFFGAHFEPKILIQRPASASFCRNMSVRQGNLDSSSD